MKAQIVEKNGFPKPLGMLLIILFLGITCFINLLFANGFPVTEEEDRSAEQIEGLPEPGIPETGFATFPYTIHFLNE